jgi:hypothetical protein
MKYRWEEVNQMRDILEAEIRGHHFDREHAHRLAVTLARMFPDCAQSMGRVAERMSSGKG